MCERLVGEPLRVPFVKGGWVGLQESRVSFSSEVNSRSLSEDPHSFSLSSFDSSTNSTHIQFKN